MNSFIYIDGIVLWALVAILLMVIITWVIVICAYMRAEKDNYILKTRNRRLMRELSATQDKLYKKNFKVPDIEVISLSEQGEK